MLLLPVIVLASQFSGIIALPLNARTNKAAKASSAASAAVTVTPANVEGDEVELNGAFNTAVSLGGGNIKTDVIFPKGAVGSFEFEFQDATANTVTVTENKTPGKAPAGFAFLDPSSYKVSLGRKARNATLQKIDIIFDPALPALAGVDISQAKIGKLKKKNNTFVINDKLGEQEFEADENEVTLTVKNGNGEWGIFIPTAAVANPAASSTAASASSSVSASASSTSAAAPAASTTAAAEGEKDEDEITGAFDTAIATPAGNRKTDIIYPANAAGAFEVEINATLANAITVKTNKTPVAPPKGFLFVDPVTYQVSTASKTAANDLVKIDYFYSDAVLAAADVKQGVIGKLDTATNQFITDLAVLKAEFEFEEEEKEWTLTVPDLNGEWAILIPEAAVLKSAKTLTL